MHIDVALDQLDEIVEEEILFFLLYDLDGHTATPFNTLHRCGNKRYEANREVEPKPVAIFCLLKSNH